MMDDLIAAEDLRWQSEQVGGSNLPAPSQSGWASGILQQAVALGGQYLSKRIDIDLQQRAAGNMPQPYRIGTGQPLYDSTVMPQTGAFRPDLTTRTVSAVGGLRMGDLLPFAAIGLVAFLFLGKR